MFIELKNVFSCNYAIISETMVNVIMLWDSLIIEKGHEIVCLSTKALGSVIIRRVAMHFARQYLGSK